MKGRPTMHEDYPSPPPQSTHVKVLEASRRQKSVGKGSSAMALKPKAGGILPSKSPEPFSNLPPVEMGVQHGDSEICPNPSKNSTGNKKSPVPKTKFTCNDKSSEFHISPRLKSFPAEELRRYDASPRIEIAALPPFQISGEGDSLLVPHSSPNISHQNPMNQQISQPISNQMSQQNVFNVHHQRSPERQAHRPFVPRPIDHENRVPIEYQSEGNFIKKKEPVEEMERQPVGGRNAAMFQQQFSGGNQNNLKTNVIPEEQAPQRNERNHVQFADVHQEIPPQGMYYEHYNPNQQIVQQFPEQSALQFIPGLGMTSPQDLMINQSKSYQYPLQYPVYPEQSGTPWLQNPCHHPQPSLPRNHHHLHQEVSSPQEEQQREYPRQKSKDDGEKNVNTLKFSREMIRDQERLVETLRQQGFDDDVIRRQFDGLLSEQKRELLYLQEIEKAQNSTDDSNNAYQPVRRRRITRIEEDEKPEWMMHITPPWVSYASLEKQASNDNQKEQKNDEGTRQIPEEQQHFSYAQQNTEIHQHPHHQCQHQQMIDPRMLQQWQQQMMQPNPHNHVQYAHNHQHHHQSAPNHFSPQLLPSNNEENIVMQQQIQQDNCELIPQEQKPRVEPSSLLKLRMYKDVVKRQKQNNGLQDPETIKEALAALKNPANEKGLEYLANMEKREQQVKLNGIQDPDEKVIQNWPHCPPEYVIQQTRKEPSANGLENRRNPDNPLPKPTLHLKNMDAPMPLYPGRIGPDERYYAMMAQRPNATANHMIQNQQNFAPVFQNPGDPVNNGYQNCLPAQVYAQVQGSNCENHNHGSCCIGRSNSLPCNMYSQHRPDHIHENETMKSCLKNGRQNRPDEVVPYEGNNQQERFYMQRPLQEPMLIGGVKYLGRKAEFIPNSHPRDAAMGNGGQPAPLGYQCT